MTYRTIDKIAEELGTEVEHKQYSYWESVPHINNTAIYFDVVSDNNHSCIITNPENFPQFATKEYIKDCIESEKETLGLRRTWVCGVKPFGGKNMVYK